MLGLATNEDRRAFLQRDFSPAELCRVGFGEVSIEQCIEHALRAAHGVSPRPDAAVELRDLGLWLRFYDAAAREVEVRRVAGAASCLPSERPIVRTARDGSADLQREAILFSKGRDGARDRDAGRGVRQQDRGGVAAAERLRSTEA